MKKKNYVFFVCLALLSCKGLNDSDINGKAYDILEPKVYNELQKEFLTISDFEKGTAVVVKDVNYGLINRKGKVLLPCTYEYISPLEDDMRSIRVNNLYGMVNADGEICISCEYEQHMHSKNPNYQAFKKNGKWGFLSKEEQIMIQFKYDNLERLTDSTFIAYVGNKCGLFRYSGDCILEPIYDEILYKVLDQPNDPSYVCSQNKMAILNSHNQFVTDFIYADRLTIPELGKYIQVSKAAISEYSYKNRLYGIIEYETGKEVIPCMYEDLGKISEGVIYAKLKGKYGYIDINNKTIVPFEYNDAEDFSEGLARVAIHGGYYNSVGGRLSYSNYGFIDKSGNFIIEPRFPDPMLNAYDSNGFYNGLAAMGEHRKNNIYANRFGYINRDGIFEIKPIYEQAHRFINGIALVKKDNKYGCIDTKGNIVVDFIHDDFKNRSIEDSVVVLIKDEVLCTYKLDGTPFVN